MSLRAPADTSSSAWSYAASLFEPPVRRWASPLDMAQDLDPTIVRTPALDLINQALVDLVDGDDDRLIVSMPPQEAKSTTVSRWYPDYLLSQVDPDLRIIMISYSDDIARRWGADVKRDFETFNGDDDSLDLGVRLRADSRAAGRWQVEGHKGGMFCAGVAGSVTGRPADLILIDDPIKDLEQAKSVLYRERFQRFWQGVAIPRLGPGAKVCLIQTRWHEDDAAGWLIRGEGNHRTGGRWHVLNIPAQADHDPNKGETDPLGREPGEYMISARGNRDWDGIKKSVGSYVWAALYQGRPAPAEGNIFQRSWWKFYEQPQWVERSDGARIALGFDEVLTSWDMTFKNTEGTDYVVGQVWGRRGADAYLLDQVHRRMTFVESAQAVRDLAARWPDSLAKLVEDKANGSAVMDYLRRTVPGLIPIEPSGSKTARAAAVSPLVEAGNVWLPAPEIYPWIGDLIEEASGFPNASHDDQVDAMSQALYRLVINPLIFDDRIVEDDEDGPAEGSISLY